MNDTDPQPTPVPGRSSGANTPVLKRRSTWIVGALALLGLTAGAVQAQWDRGPGMRSHQEGGRGARLARFCAGEPERFAPVARAYVKADLRLDARQAGEFDRLADIVLPGLTELKRKVCDDFARRGAPTPERLAQLAENLRRAADLAQSAIEPARGFYATLDEAQKARVDALAQPRGDRR
jgi:hypothetical protein